MFCKISFVALIIFASLASVVDAAVPCWSMGQHRGGNYSAGGDPIRFVALHFRGSFNYANIQDAFGQAVRGNREARQTASRDKDVNNNDKYGNQTMRLASDRHAVLGWINERSGEFFFVGVRVDGNGRRYHYLTKDGNSGSGGAHFQDWQWRTNGYRVFLHFADDNNHGIAWRFRGPM